MTFLMLACLMLDPPDLVVANGKVPKDAHYTLAFEEDLRFGAEEDGDEYLWASPLTDLAVDAKGHIFIGDPKTNEIREFDSKGAFIRLIAGKGMGPGELQALRTIQFLKDDRLVVFEQTPGFLPRIQFFDGDRKYTEMKKPKTMNNIPVSITIDPAGSFFAGAMLVMNAQEAQMITKTGVGSVDDFNLDKEWSSVASRADFARMADPNVFADLISDIISAFFKGAGVFTFNEKGELYTSFSKKYEITHWDSAERGKKLKVIKKEYKALANTEEQKQAVVDYLMEDFRASPMGPMINEAFVNRVMNRLELPEARDPISGLIATPEGWLLVVHDFNLASGSQSVDIFDEKGLFRGVATMEDWAFMNRASDARMVFKNNFAYTIHTDEEDNNVLVRYKYKLVKK